MEPPSHEVLDHARNELTAALVATYRDRLLPSHITEITHTTWEHLHDQARVAIYLPLLARRAAETRIRQTITADSQALG